MSENIKIKGKHKKQSTRQGGDAHESTKTEQNQPRTEFSQAPRGLQ